MKYNLVHKHLIKYLNLSKKLKSNNYSLLDDAFSNEDILAGIDVLLSKKIEYTPVQKKIFRFCLYSS